MTSEIFKQISKAVERAKAEHPEFPELTSDQINLLTEEYLEAVTAYNNYLDNKKDGSIEEFHSELDDMIAVLVRMKEAILKGKKPCSNCDGLATGECVECKR